MGGRLDCEELSRFVCLWLSPSYTLSTRQCLGGRLGWCLSTLSYLDKADGGKGLCVCGCVLSKEVSGWCLNILRLTLIKLTVARAAVRMTKRATACRIEACCTCETIIMIRYA